MYHYIIINKMPPGSSDPPLDTYHVFHNYATSVKCNNII